MKLSLIDSWPAAMDSYLHIAGPAAGGYDAIYLIAAAITQANASHDGEKINEVQLSPLEK